MTLAGHSYTSPAARFVFLPWQGPSCSPWAMALFGQLTSEGSLLAESSATYSGFGGVCGSRDSQIPKSSIILPQLCSCALALRERVRQNILFTFAWGNRNNEFHSVTLHSGGSTFPQYNSVTNLCEPGSMFSISCPSHLGFLW